MCTVILQSVMLVVSGGCQTEGPVAKEEKLVDPIVVKLSISVDEFDTAHPKGILTCVVHNTSDQEIVVPGCFDSDRTRVQAVGILDGKPGRWPLKLFRRSPSDGRLQTERLQPGQEKKIFELPLKEILADSRRAKATVNVKEPVQKAVSAIGAVSAARQPLWGWDWIAHPMPPASPIHGRNGYMDAAEFQVELMVGPTPVRSNRVTLNVTGSKVDALVAIPNVVGLARAEAEKLYVAAGLKPYFLEETTTRIQNRVATVVEQNPAAGEKVRKGSLNTVYIYGRDSE